MKKVTTITPCYNAIKYLPKCWESLKNQTIGMENMECIFVDDCSNDSTWEMLMHMEKEYPDNVIIIQLPENRRQGGARNEALSFATGEYLQFLDQDDWLEPNALEVLYNTANESDLDMLQFDYVHVNGKDINDNFCKSECLFELNDVESRKEMLASGLLYCSHHNIFYRREVWQKTKSSFPEHMAYEEPLFVYPMFFVANKIMISTMELYNMRSHSESSTETLLASHLEDHPRVQKMLLDFLREMPIVLQTYYEEIEFYFIWTYYVETIINAGCGGKLTFDCFLEMQKTVLKEFPNFEENRYLQRMGPVVEQVLDTIRAGVCNESDMNRIATDLASNFYR